MSANENIKMRNRSLLVTCAISVCILFYQSQVNGQTALLEIYLPRDAAVKDNLVSLGQISVIRGDESLAAAASEIAIGRLSTPGQEIIVDRPTVLGRLASNGISASMVKLSGAEKVTVRQQRQIIKGDEFVELAKVFLEKNPSAVSICRIEPVIAPKDLVIPADSRDIKFSTHLVKNSAADQPKVRVVVFADGKELDVREVTFRLKYNCRRAVTLFELAEGSIIGPDNVRIEKVESDHPEPADWKPPYGLVAGRRLSADTVIRPGMAVPIKPQLLLKRNQSVVIQLEKLGLLVTAVGITMQEGRVGEYIKVRNVDSQRIILARVNENGTVEPVL